MTSCGIICEYNPFHTGHAYQIEQVKKDFDAVVCVMSGDFVQRGECAFSDKYKRAQNAIESGADIVLELPFPFSSMSAEGFSRAGIEILSKSGLCSHFAFGSESADISLLLEMAKILSKTDFENDIKKIIKSDPTLSFARARSKYILEKHGEKYKNLIENPNDILAVEYLKANLLQNNPLSPIAIKRSTPRKSKDECFASSSYIRQEILQNNPEIIKEYLPYNFDSCDFYTDNSNFYEFLRLSLSIKDPDELKNIAEVSGGVNHSIVKNAVVSNSYTELVESLSNKGTTDSKVRRMLLFCLFGVNKKLLKENVLYTRVLAMNKTGQKLLSETRKERKIIIANKLSNIRQDKNAFYQYNLCEKASRILKETRK